MLARVLRLPFASGFVLTFLVSIVLLLLLAPSTGWAQGPVDSNVDAPVNGSWTPLDGGELTSEQGATVPPPAAPSQKGEQPAGFVPSTETGSDDPLHRPPMVAPAISDERNEPVNGAQDGSTQSVPEDWASVQGSNAMAASYTSPLVIPAADFTNRGDTTDGYYFPLGSGYFRPTGTGACMMAPAYLPHRATVTSMYVSVYDNGGFPHAWLNLYRVYNGTGVMNIMGGVATTATSATIQNKTDFSISFPDVSLQYYSYYVGTCLSGTSQRIYSVRLYYTGP